MAYKLIYFIVLLTIGISSWIQNPSPILAQPFDGKSVALGGINSFEKSDVTSIQFSYSSSSETIFEESSIIFNKDNRSYYFSYFGVPQLHNTIDAWSDNGDGVPSSDEIDYTRITSFEYKSINFTYPIELSVSNLEIWPTFSFSSLYDANSYSVGFSISERVSYKNTKLIFFIHDAFSSKWWSTKRLEMYIPFVELILKLSHNNMNILLNGILGKSNFNGSVGMDIHIYNNFSLRGGYESSGIFSFGTGIKMNFIELDIGIVPSNTDHPFKPTQKITLKLLTDKVWSATKRLRP